MKIEKDNQQHAVRPPRAIRCHVRDPLLMVCVCSSLVQIYERKFESVFSEVRGLEGQLADFNLVRFRVCYLRRACLCGGVL